MQKTQLVLPECYDKICIILAVSTGNKITDIFPYANLVTDLGLNLKADLSEIIRTLNHEYAEDDINLSLKEVIQELESLEEPTVLELAQLVQEIKDLG